MNFFSKLTFVINENSRADSKFNAGIEREVIFLPRILNLRHPASEYTRLTRLCTLRATGFLITASLSDVISKLSRLVTFSDGPPNNSP